MPGLWDEILIVALFFALAGWAQFKMKQKHLALVVLVWGVGLGVIEIISKVQTNETVSTNFSDYIVNHPAEGWVWITMFVALVWLLVPHFTYRKKGE